MHFASNFPRFSEFFIKIAQFDLNQSGTNTSEIESGIGDSGIVAKALGLAQQFGDFSEIKYIGVTGDPGVLGLASTEYNNQLLQGLFDKITAAKSNWENLSESEKTEINTIQMNAERLSRDTKLVAFQVNPSQIIQTSQNYLNGLELEIQNYNTDWQTICKKSKEEVFKDICVIILASVLAHEGTHASLGGSAMRGEGEASGVERDLLHKAFRDTSSLPEYNYLGNFQIIQNNIQ